MPKLIHAMIRVRSISIAPPRSISKGSASKETHRMELRPFALLYRSSESGFEIELTWNKGQSEPYAHGAAYGHVAFCVDDLARWQQSTPQGRLGYTVGDIKELAAPSGNGAILLRHRSRRLQKSKWLAAERGTTFGTRRPFG